MSRRNYYPIWKQNQELIPEFWYRMYERAGILNDGRRPCTEAEIIQIGEQVRGEIEAIKKNDLWDS